MAIIAVFNQKGGVGKTTTALNLLAAFARSGRRPTGIDLDPQAHLSRVLGVEPRHGEDTLYGFFVQQRPLDDLAVITKSGLGLVPAHLELAKVDSMLGKGVNVVTRLRQALRVCHVITRPVVIDCCPLLNALSLNALFAERDAAISALVSRFTSHPWSVNFLLIVSPLVTWIWLGALIVLFGAFIAGWPSPRGLTRLASARYAARVGRDVRDQVPA